MLLIGIPQDCDDAVSKNMTQFFPEDAEFCREEVFTVIGAPRYTCRQVREGREKLEAGKREE